MAADDELITVFRDQRKESEARRARNRATGLAVLRSLGVQITAKNRGSHLIVRTGAVVIDYWPGTGLWRRRTLNLNAPPPAAAKDQRGIASLKAYIQSLEIPKT